MRRAHKGTLILAVMLPWAAFSAASGCHDPLQYVRPLGGDTGGHQDGGQAGAGGSIFEDAGSQQPSSLAFEPPGATLVIDGSGKVSATFVLQAKDADGKATPVVAEALQFDRPDLGTVTPGAKVVVTADGSYAGTGELHGVYQGLEAIAVVKVQVHKKSVADGVDPAVVAALDQPDLPDDPLVNGLRYPYDATVFPLGLASPLLMWNAPSDKDVYRVRYEEAGYSADFYATVTGKGQLRVDQSVWDHLTASNGGDPVKVTLSRYDAAQKTAFLSATEKWTIAPSSLAGAIYYWTTSGGGHLSRIQPGIGAHPAVVNNGKCMGCHAVSADGSTLVAADEDAPAFADGLKNRAWMSFDLPAGTIRAESAYYAGMLAVNPDGKYVVFGSQKLRLGTTKDGQYLPSSGLEALPLDPGMTGRMMPAFSPDGKHLVAVEGAGSGYHNLTGGKLVLIDFDEKTATFSNLQSLAPAAAFPQFARAIAYPTVAPDSQWVAFGVSNYPTGCDAQGCSDQTQQFGSIWLQRTTGTPPVRLAALSDPPTTPVDGNVAFEPTFNPAERGGYFWLVFTSMRDWGNELTGTPNNGKKRLWVAAIDKDPKSGADPSHPAFFLEGQEEATVNMRGFWSLAPCIAAGDVKGCSAGFECCSGFCTNGQCVNPNSFACKGAGDACTSDADCCNAGYVSCVNHVCTPIEPK
jgi:hypothetical protein